MSIDWSKLSFSYTPTKCHIRYVWRDGKWSSGELVESPYVQLHIGATALHYGQSLFEGMKAYRGKDGKIRVFRPEMNARRINNGARRTMMAEIPEEMFLDAIKRVVKANEEYIPPYGTGATLYIRPLLFGSGPQIGVNPADEYTFIIMVTPVGPYYKGGIKPVHAMVLDEYDRAAPLGTGQIKLAGNYAASLLPHNIVHEHGFPVELYLDAKEHKYVEEFGTSNFIGVDKSGKFVTAKSTSILPSVTTNGLVMLAKHLGMGHECRPIAYDELESNFAEVGACGTAVVITPVNAITRGDKTIEIGPKDCPGPYLQKLYDNYTAIQWGEAEDVFGWLHTI